MLWLNCFSSDRVARDAGDVVVEAAMEVMAATMATVTELALPGTLK